MKGILGFAFFLLFLAGITFVMMQGKEMARQNMPGGGVGMTGVTWRPTIVGTEELPADSGMFVQFAVDGSIDGNGGCNSFFGSLQKVDDGRQSKASARPLGALVQNQIGLSVGLELRCDLARAGPLRRE